MKGRNLLDTNESDILQVNSSHFSLKISYYVNSDLSAI